MTDPLLEGLPDAGNDPLLGGLPDQPRPARPAVLRAGQHQPDQYAEAARRSATLGVPTDVVLRNGDQTRQMEIERSLDGLRKSNPELADWLLAGDNLTVAQDDVSTLGKVASGVQSVAKYLAAPQRGLNQGVGAGISGLGDLLDAGAYGLARLTGGEDAAAQYDREARASSTNPSNWLRSLGDWVSDGGLLGTMAQVPADSTGVRNPFTPLEAGESNTTLAVLEGLGNLTGQAVATTANPTAGLAMLLGQGADQQADMARAAGAEGTGEAYAAIAASAPVAAALNKIGLDRILKHAPPGIQNSVARYITDKLAAAGVEATTEAAEQVVYNALAQSTYNPNQSLTEGVRENFEVGGLVGGIARVLVGARYARTRTEQEGAVLDALTTDAAASRLRQRDPERFRELVAGMTQTGADKVYVNAEAALTYFQSAGIEPSTLVNADELSEAVALGGDIAIPMADYLTKIAPDHHAGLARFARLTPGGMSRADLATFDEQAEAAAQRFLSSVDEAAGAESDVRVYQDVLGQLLGTGMDRSVAEKNAALMQSVFRSLAQRSGRDAADLYQQYGLRIVQDQPEALSVLRRTPNIEATVDSLLDRLSVGDIPTEAAALGQSLVEWLAGAGGVTDPVMTGELRRLNESDRVNRRGKARLVRPDAKLTLDYAREAAAEAGYLPMDSTVNDLLDAITEEVDGGRAIRVGGNPELSNLRAALMEADSLLGRAGIDPADRDAARRYLLGGGEFDQPAYHGTPHTVDRFSLQKIGTGEGAQAYGWGLYFASKKEVAESYRRDLAGDGYRTAAGGIFKPDTLDHLSIRVAARRNGTNLDATIARGEELLANEDDPNLRRMIESDIGALRALRDSGGLTENLGNLYQVEVPDDGDLLDWDKPLSQQPEKVRAALAAMDPDTYSPDGNDYDANETGQMIYHRLQNDARDYAITAGRTTETTLQESAAKASRDLLAFGIPGLRYLDGNSRAGGEGSHNYVIWDENAISEPEQVFYQDALPDADLVATLRARIAELERELRTDKLTGMRNRAAFDEDEALGWPNVAVLDLDGLKAVNDDVGHAAGDELLRKAGEVMLAAEGDGVRFYRQGGDEYTARFADGVDAEAVMREVRDRLSSVDVVMETDDGLQIYRGIGAGYGIGPDFKTADARQNADKERRVATGERSPRGLSRAADRLVGLAQGRQVADRQEQGRAGEPVAQENGLEVELNQSLNPNIDVSPTTGTREVKIGDTTITYGIARGGETGEVILISTPATKRGKGSARAAMQQFLLATDRAGITMFLTAEPMGKGGASKSALEKFYKSLGFRSNKGRKADFRSRQAMVRDPRTVELNQSQVDQTQTPEFRRWFGDSKVVDADGRPLVVYHGTASDFDEFVIGDEGDVRGIFLTPYADQASRWAQRKTHDIDETGSRNRTGDGENIMPVYVSIQKAAGPADLRRAQREIGPNWTASEVTDRLIAYGFDGYIDSLNEIVAFRPEQIKSATANSGAFDPNNPSILNQSDRMAEAIRRGYIKFAGDRQFTIGLTENADLSTFLHESAHFFLEVMGDLAADPNVPETIAQDYAAIVRWLGVSSRAEIGTEQHEKFARGFERYLGEGKAPTPELEGAFVRFRAWIKAIYKTLTALNVELTDEVRGVFDRMVAGDEAITRAEQAANMEPLFKEAAAAGMTEARFREYLRLQAAGREEAEARIARRAVEEVSRERKQWWREESESVQREVEAELGAQPVYQAWANLARGTLPDGSPLPDGVEAIKLDKGWLLDRYGQEFLNKNLRRRNVYAVEGGQDGDVVAAMFGYTSGDELVTALANAVPYKAAVRAETLARMRERHGDLRMDPKLPETAMRAVHNDKRMKAIEADVRVLEELTSTPRMDARAVRRWAEGKVGRTRLRDLTPSAYLRAERKAAREAIRAAAAGDMAGALTAQRRRLANANLYDLAAKAVEEGERIRRYVKRFDKKALRARLGKVDRLTQADALLQQYDFARVSGREIDRGKARGELLAAIEAGEITAPRSVVERLGAQTTNWRDVPMDDLRGFRDVLKQFEAQARAEYETLVNGQRRLVEDDANAVAESISRKGTRIDLSLSGDDLGDSARRTAREALSAWLRPSEIARQLDSGDDYGPMTRLVIEPVRRAYSETLEPMLHKARQDVSDLYRKHYTLPELGKFGQRRQIAPLKGAYTKAELLALALNWGNADNRQAVLDSMVGGQRPMTEPGVLQAFRENLDARDWAFVQDVWQYLDTYWPQAKAVEQRRKGVTPKKVQPTPFQVQTADGQTLDIAGGYYRLKYNPSKDSRVANDEVEDLFKRVMVGGHVSSSTRAGSQNERVGSAGRPVWLDLSVIDSHLTEVIRDIALSEPVAHVYKVLNSKQVRQAMTLTGNKPVEATLERWLKDAAAGDLAAQGFLEKSTAWLRTGFSKSKMAWKATTMLLQFTGVFQTAVVVGKANFAAGAGRWMQNPRKWHQHIMAESAFMRTRYELQAWNKDVQDTRTFLNAMAGPTPTRVKQAIDAISATYFLPLAKSQMLVDEMTWMAGYHKGVNERGLGHDDAILYADSVVENAQTSGLFSDRSALERGTINNRAVQSQFIRIWTTLGSYMIAKGNIAYGRAREVVRRPTVPNIANFATDMVLLFMVEAVAGMLIRGNWPDDEDETEVAKAVAGETVASVMGTVPFVRELPSAKYGSGNTPIGAFVGDAYKAGYQVSQGELDPQAIKAVNNLGGTLFHYPSAQMNVLVDSYWADQVEGQDVSPYEYVVTGPKE